MCTLKDNAEILLHKSYCLFVIFHRLKFRQNSPFELKYPTSYLFCIDINPYIKRHNHSLVVEYRVLQLNAIDIIGIHLMQTYILKRRESSGRPQVKMRWQIILINACRNELIFFWCDYCLVLPLQCHAITRARNANNKILQNPDVFVQVNAKQQNPSNWLNRKTTHIVWLTVNIMDNL